MIQGFDEDENGILDSTELANWRLATEQMFTEWNWQPSPEYRCFLISTWNQTDFQTHFAPILDFLSDCCDFEHVENI